MSAKITFGAYKTKLGNPVAKSILALLADQVCADGSGLVSIRSIPEYAEVESCTVRRLIQIFEEIGLLKREPWFEPASGTRLNIAIQFSLEKLGTDLRREFAAALSKVQAKVSPATAGGVFSGLPTPPKSGTVIEPLGTAQEGEYPLENIPALTL